MGIHIEPLIFVVRGGDSFLTYGDPYEWACTCVKVDDNKVKVLGASGKMGIKDVRLAISHLKEFHGFTDVIWERKKSNGWISGI